MICSFLECQRQRYAKGLCSAHYKQQCRGVPLTPIRPYESTDGTCRFPDCGRPIDKRQLCSGHYKQAQEGRALAPLRAYAPSSTRREGLKRCRQCRTWLDEAEFYPSNSRMDGLTPECRPCSLGRHLKKFQMTVADFAAMLAAQGGGCANKGCDSTQPGGNGRWHVDHDHACCPGNFSCGRCVRGLLCSRCNVMLGMAQDSVARLRGAIDYLEAHRD